MRDSGASAVSVGRMRRNVQVFLAAALSGSAVAVPPGFEIRDFAGPPEVDYPTAVMAAANGDI